MRTGLSLAHARAVLAAWRDDYNHVRPHGALGGLTPVEAAALARPIHNEHNRKHNSVYNAAAPERTHGVYHLCDNAGCKPKRHQARIGQRVRNIARYVI